MDQGQLVKSKQRTKNHELFLMVLFEPRPSKNQFNAVVIKDFAGFEKAGFISNTWNTDEFELTEFSELFSAITAKGII